MARPTRADWAPAYAIAAFLLASVWIAWTLLHPTDVALARDLVLALLAAALAALASTIAYAVGAELARRQEFGRVRRALIAEWATNSLHLNLNRNVMTTFGQAPNAASITVPLYRLLSATLAEAAASPLVRPEAVVPLLERQSRLVSFNAMVATAELLMAASWSASGARPDIRTAMVHVSQEVEQMRATIIADGAPNLD